LYAGGALVFWRSTVHTFAEHYTFAQHCMLAEHCMPAGQCMLAEHCMPTKDIECWLHAATSFCECMLSTHMKCEFSSKGDPNHDWNVPPNILFITHYCGALYFVPQPVFFAELLDADNHPILYEFCGFCRYRCEMQRTENSVPLRIV
jgi:hypothetical protein